MLGVYLHLLIQAKNIARMVRFAVVTIVVLC